MTSKSATRIALLLAFIVGFTACDNKPHFTVKGKIEGAADSVLYFYKRGITGVDLVDSAKIRKDATFELKSQAPQYPDLYVLALGKQMINLAVDSIETIEIDANKKDFAIGYQVKGSPQSDIIRQLYLKQVEASKTLRELKSQLDKKMISDSSYVNQARLSVSAYKQEAQKVILANLRGMAAYYALFQQIDGYTVFDPLDKQDSRLFAAVATSWDTFSPQSPRSEHLKKYTLNALGHRRMMEGKGPDPMQKASVVDASKFFNISLPGLDDRHIELNSLRGKVVLLDFTMYQAQESPAHNIALNKAYEKFRNSGFVIYQVSFNTALHFWRTSASNLPWVCVREDDPNSPLIARFNIREIPTMFLIDRQGEIIKRLSPKENIVAEVERVL
jgi:glutathione peroxidase-family protein